MGTRPQCYALYWSEFRYCMIYDSDLCTVSVRYCYYGIGNSMQAPQCYALAGQNADMIYDSN